VAAACLRVYLGLSILQKKEGLCSLGGVDQGGMVPAGTVVQLLQPRVWYSQRDPYKYRKCDNDTTSTDDQGRMGFWEEI